MVCRRPLLKAATLTLLVLMVAMHARPGLGRGRRFHVMTPGQYQRLDPRTRANADAVAKYFHGKDEGGTAFLVTAADAQGVALAMTNQHVVGRRSGKGDELRFMPGGVSAKEGVAAPVIEVVARSRWHDYALVRVRLPEALRSLRPIRLEGRRVSPDRIYSVGFPQLTPFIASNKVWSSIGYAPTRKEVRETRGVELQLYARFGRVFNRLPWLYNAASRLLPRALLWRETVRLKGRHLLLSDRNRREGTPKTIQVGTPTGVANRLASKVGWTLRGSGGRLRSYWLPSNGGASGSPIFSAETHRAVSLLHGGVRVTHSLTDGHTMRGILGDLGGKLHRGAIAPAHRAAIQELLHASGAP